MTTRTWLTRSADPLGRPILCLAVLLGALVGCENPNEAFSGRWGPVVSPESFEGSAVDLDWGQVWPQLHLGHYGQEVAGIVTFHKTELATDRASECPCAFVEHSSLNLDSQTLVVTTRCPEASFDWDLAITRDEGDGIFLKGWLTIHDIDRNSKHTGKSDKHTIRLERLADEVNAHDPSCEASPP
jgi:hypothetical protein